MRYLDRSLLAPGFFYQLQNGRDKKLFGLSRFSLRRQEITGHNATDSINGQSTSTLLVTSFNFDLFYGRLWTIEYARNGTWNIDVGFAVQPGFSSLKNKSQLPGGYSIRAWRISTGLEGMLQLNVKILDQLNLVGGYSMAFLNHRFTQYLGGRRIDSKNVSQVELFPTESSFRLGVSWNCM